MLPGIGRGQAGHGSHRAGALGLEVSAPRRGEEARREHHHRRAEVPRGARGHDGRHELPVADGLRDEPGRGHRADLAVEPRRADGERGPDRCGRSLALQWTEQLPQHQGDRGLGDHPWDERRREGNGPLAAADPAAVPLLGRRRGSRRSSEGVQHLWPQPVRQGRHDDGRPVEAGGTEGGPGPARGPRHCAGLLRRRLAPDGWRPGHDLPAAGQRDAGGRPAVGPRS